MACWTVWDEDRSGDLGAVSCENLHFGTRVLAEIISALFAFLIIPPFARFTHSLLIACFQDYCHLLYHQRESHHLHKFHLDQHTASPFNMSYGGGYGGSRGGGGGGGYGGSNGYSNGYDGGSQRYGSQDYHGGHDSYGYGFAGVDFHKPKQLFISFLLFPSLCSDDANFFLFTETAMAAQMAIRTVSRMATATAVDMAAAVEDLAVLAVIACPISALA